MTFELNRMIQIKWHYYLCGNLGGGMLLIVHIFCG